MICMYCGEQDIDTEAGFVLTYVFAAYGKKTEKQVLHRDTFPDGTEKKYLCYECSYDLGLAEPLCLEDPTLP